MISVTLMLAVGVVAVVVPHKLHKIAQDYTRRNGAWGAFTRPYIESDAYIGVTRAVGWVAIIVAVLIGTLALADRSIP